MGAGSEKTCCLLFCECGKRRQLGAKPGSAATKYRPNRCQLRGYHSVMATPSSIPAGFNTLTPYLVVDDADAAIALYEKAFGAKAVSVHRLPDGKVMNAQLRIGDSMLMLNAEFPDYGVIGPNKIGNSAVTMHLYVDDVDTLWKKATDAGFEVKMPA